MAYLGDIDPAEWGLEYIGEIDAGEMYEYDVIGVWRGIQSRKLYYDTDGGCSCSYAWDLTVKEDLKEVSKSELLEVLKTWANDHGSKYGPTREDLFADVIELFQRL